MWCAALLSLALLAALSAGSASTAAKPNFIVLFVDDLGYDQINVPSAYGYTGDNGTVHTPNLARLREEGLLFTSWYSSFHVCSPSRSSMMTGRYSIRLGIGIPPNKYAPNAPGPSAGANEVLTAEAIGGLPLNETTTAEMLKTAGYSTLMVGKWHLGVRDMYMPSNRGFDSYYGVPFSQDMGLSFWEGGKEMKPRQPYQPTPLPLVNGTTIVEQPVALDTLAERYAATVSSFVTQNAAAGDPFYVYASFNHVHGPNSCSSAHCGQSTRGPVGDAIQEMDWAIGEIMQTLRQSPAANNTLVFFTSDNGAPLGNDGLGNLPLRDGKASCWDGGFRMPAMAWFPGRIPAGSSTDAVVSTLDIHPTLGALAEVAPPTDRIIDGLDISPILFQGATKGHACYFFYSAAVAADARNGLAAVRCGPYKGYYTIKSTRKQPWAGTFDPPLIFNVRSDPGETTPISQSSPEYQTAFGPIKAAREAHLATITPVPDQNGRGSDPHNAFCSDPHSQAKYPGLPNCTLNPDNWMPSVCNASACLKADPAFVSRCAGSKVCPGPHCPAVPASAFVGCYHDHADEGQCDLPVIKQGHCKGETPHHLSDDMSVNLCNALCTTKYAFFAVQYGGSGCFCGNAYGSQGAAAPAACNMTCPSSGTKQNCGGPNLNAVYHTVA